MKLYKILANRKTVIALKNEIYMKIDKKMMSGFIRTDKIRSGLSKSVLTGVGSIFVGLGILGIFLPLLPATPFFLLAAACYARSSKRFYNLK